jgi:hypothetical protein
MGFTLRGDGETNEDGIYATRPNIEVRNGTVQLQPLIFLYRQIQGCCTSKVMDSCCQPVSGSCLTVD